MTEAMAETMTEPMTGTTTGTTTSTDNKHGFDFWRGTWHTHNRKLVDVFDPDCTEWIEFDAVCEARAVLTGLGNIDTFVTEMPGRGHFEGFTLRLFDPATETWKIWWASVRDPGRLDTPVEGRFVDGVGRFYADEEVDGRVVKVQFEWTVESADLAHWRQRFSFDGGQTWQLNWTMAHTRVS
jgi:hypothetical protein